MKFMTPATLSNPNRLGNVLSDMKEDRLLKAKQKRISQVAENIMDGISALSPDQKMNMDAVMQVAKNSFVPGMTGNEKQLAAKMALEYQQNAQVSNQNKQNRLLFNEQRQEKATADRDFNIADQINFPQTYGQEGTYAAPPPDERSMVGEMSPKGRTQFLLNRNKSALDRQAADLKQQETLANINYKNAQAKNLGKNKGKTEEQAKADLKMSFGDQYDQETQTVLIPANEKGIPLNKNDLIKLDQSGFKFDTPDGVIKTDKTSMFGLKGENKYAIVARLGAFDHDKVGGQSNYVDDRGSNTFDALYNIIKNPKPFNVAETPTQADDQTPKPMPNSKFNLGGLAGARKEISKIDKPIKINKELPADPSTWDVKKRFLKGNAVQTAKVKDKLIPLTPDELSLYYRSEKEKRKAKFKKYRTKVKKYMSDDPTGIKKLRKEYKESN